MKETILYIVKEKDTLKSIALEHKTSIEEIIRLNPITKYRLIEGQPLILLKDNQKENDKILKPSLSYVDLCVFAFYLKETMLSSFYYPFLKDYLKKKTKNTLFYILQKLDQYNQDEINQINTYLDELLSLPEILKKKDETLLLDYEKRLRNFNEHFSILMSKNQMAYQKDVMKKTLRSLLDRIQLYALKAYAQKGEEAEDIFISILKDLYLL